MATANRTHHGRGRLLLAAAIATSAAALMALGALVASALTCDESCDAGSARWQDRPDAWQWDAQLVIAALGLCGALAFAAAAIPGRRRLARAVVAITIACMLAWCALMGFLVLGLALSGLVALLAYR
jgi:hypothetical protein